MTVKTLEPKLVAGQIMVTQIGSSIGRKYDQEQTLIGLGLNKMHKSVTLANTPSIMGMVKKVRHLVKFTIIS